MEGCDCCGRVEGFSEFWFAYVDPGGSCPSALVLLRWFIPLLVEERALPPQYWLFDLIKILKISKLIINLIIINITKLFTDTAPKALPSHKISNCITRLLRWYMSDNWTILNANLIHYSFCWVRCYRFHALCIIILLSIDSRYLVLNTAQNKVPNSWCFQLNCTNFK